jgi:hypothetical protein
MRTFVGVILAFVVGGAEPAEDPAAKVAAQKKKAEENWEMVEAGPFAHLETRHLLLYAPSAMEKQLKPLGAFLEKHHDLAWAALQLEKKDELPGKVTVYLFAAREPFTAFLRRVEKRRVQADDEGNYSAADDDLHAAAGPARKGGLPPEAVAGQQLAALLLARKAGKNTPLPGWLLSGFGRATYYRAAPPGTKVVLDERRQAARLARVRSAADVWNGTADSEEMNALSGSLVDFLAYGPGAGKFPSLVVGFRPDENQDSRTAAQAMEAAGLMGDVIDKRWRAWAAR